MTGYVLTTDPDEVERRRMDLLFRYHGSATFEALQAGGVRSGSRALEAGPGGGDITRPRSPGAQIVIHDAIDSARAHQRQRNTSIRRSQRSRTRAAH